MTTRLEESDEEESEKRGCALPLRWTRIEATSARDPLGRVCYRRFRRAEMTNRHCSRANIMLFRRVKRQSPSNYLPFDEGIRDLGGLLAHVIVYLHVI